MRISVVYTIYLPRDSPVVSHFGTYSFYTYRLSLLGVLTLSDVVY